jgi:prepilin-type N-terminal cleavage/methylation domain-containing protein
MTRRRGMTIIELIVVISLMAIIAGASAPALAAHSHPRDENDLDVVVAVLRGSRATAIQRSTAVSVTIDPTTARYWVDPPDTTAVLSLPPQATLSARSARVHFRFAPDGQAVSDEPLFVHDAAEATPILIEAWTGEVRSARR